jgi:hypothetical protein
MRDHDFYPDMYCRNGLEETIGLEADHREPNEGLL